LTGIDPITDVAVPGAVWLLMLVVGLELSPADFRRVLASPKTIAIATLGQLLMLPTISAILIHALDPEPHLVAGMVLLAACPGGAISNFYAYLAGANVALSVTLTAVSSGIALVTMPPLTAAGFALFLEPGEAIHVPVVRMAVQLAVMLVMPVTLGMALRRWRPVIVERHALGLRRLSLGTLAALVAVILADQRHNLAGETLPVILAAALFSLTAMATGWGVGRLARLNRQDRFTLLLEFAARNLGIAAVAGILVFGRADFVLFATVFFVVQVPLILFVVAPLALRSRRSMSSAGHVSTGQGP
jgi:BASS family bile acid:Na+ symporter